MELLSKRLREVAQIEDNYLFAFVSEFNTGELKDTIAESFQSALLNIAKEIETCYEPKRETDILIQLFNDATMPPHDYCKLYGVEVKSDDQASYIEAMCKDLLRRQAMVIFDD